MSNKINRRALLLGTVAGAATLSLNARGASHATTEHQVDIVGFAFSPDSLNVKVGDTITWTNRDSARHTATADNGSWNTGTLAKNAAGSVVVTEGMALEYHCRFHPNMKASLNIQMG